MCRHPPSPSSEAASSSELLAGEWGEGTRPSGRARGSPACAAPDKMSWIMKPLERSGADLVAMAAARAEVGEEGPEER